MNADTIVRNRDMYLEGQVQSYNAGLSSATTHSQYLNQIQSLLQEPGSGGGISTQLDAFFNDWQAVAANPADSTTRSTLLDAAQQLAQSLQDLRSGLLSVQSSVDQDLSASVTQVNQLTAELAQNNQLTTNASSNGSAPLSLEDQRDALMEQLAQLTGAANTSPQQSTAAGAARRRDARVGFHQPHAERPDEPRRAGDRRRPETRPVPSPSPAAPSARCSNSARPPSPAISSSSTASPRASSAWSTSSTPRASARTDPPPA